MRSRFIWRALRARYRDQKAELKAISEHIKSGDVVCDIGANKGSYLFWLSRWAVDGQVIAFEAQSSLASYLKDLCKKVGLTNVTVEQCAVYSTTGERQFYIPEPDSPGATLIDHSSNCDATIVKTVSLDDYFYKRTLPSILKIDVEGAELDVFQGAERILKERGPVLIFECEQRHLNGSDVTDVFSYLINLGYRGRFIKNGRLLDISEFQTDVHQIQKSGRFWEDREYCNNFVFVK